MNQLFSNLKIKTKVMVGLAAVLAILLAISVMAIWSFASTEKAVTTYSQQVRLVAVARSLDRDVLELRRFAREYGTTGEDEDAQQVMVLADTLRKQIADALAASNDAERRRRFEVLSQRFEEYMANFGRIRKQGEEQAALIRDVMDPAGAQLHQDLTTLKQAAAGNASAQALAQDALEHGLLARLYANQLVGRRDAAFGQRAVAEFQALAVLSSRLEGQVKGEAQQKAFNEIKVLVPKYQKAFERIDELSRSNIDLMDRVNAGIAARIAEDAAAIRDAGIREEARIEEEVRSAAHASGRLILFLALAGLGLGALFATAIGRAIARPVTGMTGTMVELARGRLDVPVLGLDRRDEIGEMAGAVQVFKEAAQKLNAQNWVRTHVAEISTAMQTADTLRDFAQEAISRLVPLLEGGAGIFHIWNPQSQRLELLASWGFRERKQAAASYRLGEGLVGQCALEKAPILLTDVPDDYIRIVSGLGEAPPRVILVAPIVSKETLLGVIEIASFARFTPTQQTLVDELLPVIALNQEVLDRNLRTRELLEETQEQAEKLRASEEELKVQSEELQAANEELHMKSDTLQRQTEELRASEEELRAQREELQATNEELTEKGSALAMAGQEAERRAVELGLASRYKSEFLANMSHELRTPLNSLLILAKSLADNDEAHLSDDEVDSARIIHESGSHLLRLINDILDLSKVEAGKMEVVMEDIVLGDFGNSLQRRFVRLAESKGLALQVEADPALPGAMRGDLGKMDQIANNLVGNAIKFTREGRIAVRLARLPAATPGAVEHLAIAVSDTGVGVPADKLERIFRAFEQADGTTSRQFGGTGLGLSISLRLAQLLGGTIAVSSAEGQGSTFTFSVPLLPAETAVSPAPLQPVPQSDPAPLVLADDRASLAPGDEVMLIIEDDETFARILCDLSRKRGFKCLQAGDGRTGLDLAIRHRPSAILLDVGLPSLDGWSVMALLKENPATRHIPVHFISAMDDNVRGLQMGAVGYLKKPVDRDQINDIFRRLRHFAGDEMRRVLIVDDDAGGRKATNLLVQGDKIEIVEAESAQAALDRLRSEAFDCVILDLMLPDFSGFELLDRASRLGLVLPPVVVYSGKDLSDEENLRLREYTDSIVIKGVRSPERLADEVSLFLHSIRSGPPRAAAEPGGKGSELAGRTALVVDDDMRNAFALSKVLRARGLSVLIAQDGHKAIAQLESHRQVDVVLMDIMMPGMDGYATIQEIRKHAAFGRLPIIALTAKAMPGDRERCLEAGADDYAAKPVDMDQLLASIRTLLQRQSEPA